LCSYLLFEVLEKRNNESEVTVRKALLSRGGAEGPHTHRSMRQCCVLPRDQKCNNGTETSTQSPERDFSLFDSRLSITRPQYQPESHASSHLQWIILFKHTFLCGCQDVWVCITPHTVA